MARGSYRLTVCTNYHMMLHRGCDKPLRFEELPRSRARKWMWAIALDPYGRK